MEIKTKEHYRNLIKQLGRSKAYELYIASPQWKVKREQRLEIDKYQCVACDRIDNLHVHHRWESGYYNIPDEDVNDDLKTFCPRCHMALHDEYKRERYEGRDIEIQYMLPREAESELKSYGLAESELPINRREPPDYAQWRLGEPAEPDCETTEASVWQTKEDRRRFRGIG